MVLNIWVKYMNKNTNKLEKIIIILLFTIIIAIGAYFNIGEEDQKGNIVENNKISYEISNIPEYIGETYVEINNNIPKFTNDDMNLKEDYYSELENGKVGVAMVKTCWKKANEDDEKDDYSSITPSGFKQQKYDTSIIPGGYLYHRCHLIAWKLGGIDVDKRNLMTGTQSFNVRGMKQFEDKVYNYLKENQTNHVLYRVTPYFKGNNELASGVNIEAYSVEDKVELRFNVYVYNAQEGIDIDYATGESKLAE